MVHIRKDRIITNKTINVPKLYDPLDVFFKIDVDLTLLTLSKVLSLRYGIGLRFSNILVQKLGYHNSFQYKYVNNTFVIREIADLLIRLKTKLDYDLQKNFLECIGILLRKNCYRAIRYRNGYPSRGQRTRSNYKTSRRLNIDVAPLLKRMKMESHPLMRRKFNI